MVTYPKDWTKASLRDVASVITKGATPNDLAPFGDVRFIKIESIRSGNIASDNLQYISEYTHSRELHRSILAENDLLISIAATLGVVAVVPRRVLPANINQALAIVRLKSPQSARFIREYLSQGEAQEYIDSLRTISAQANLSLRQVGDLPVVLPEPREQRAIVEVLCDFDEHLANLDELIAKKKNIRNGALDQLITGDTRISDSRGPWVQISFGDSVTPKARIGWQGLKAEEYLPMGYSYLIGGTDFNSGTISLDNISFVNRERYELDPFIQVESGDVLVTKDGTIGKVALVPELNKPATLNSGVFVFRPNEHLRRDYLYWVLSSSVFTDFIEALSAGSTIKHLYQKDLKEFSFKIPSSLSEQRMIAESLFSMDQEIQMLQAERLKVEALKLGAMDDLLTGRVRLPVEEVDA